MEEEIERNTAVEFYCVINRIGEVLYHGDNLDDAVEWWVRGTVWGKGDTLDDAKADAKARLYEMETAAIADRIRQRAKRNHYQ